MFLQHNGLSTFTLKNNVIFVVSLSSIANQISDFYFKMQFPFLSECFENKKKIMLKRFNTLRKPIFCQNFSKPKSDEIKEILFLEGDVP